MLAVARFALLRDPGIHLRRIILRHLEELLTFDSAAGCQTDFGVRAKGLLSAVVEELCGLAGAFDLRHVSESVSGKCVVRGHGVGFSEIAIGASEVVPASRR